MQHPTFSATLAEQYREQLRGQADQIRLSRQGRPRSRPRRLSAARWWRPPPGQLRPEQQSAKVGPAMRLITGRQLKAELDAGQPLKLVMTAGPWQVRAKHIPGTLKLITPKDALRELRSDDPIVVYTVDDHLQSSTVA